jgi:hypothetical protein
MMRFSAASDLLSSVVETLKFITIGLIVTGLERFFQQKAAS